MRKSFLKEFVLSLLIVPFLALGACDVLGIGGVTGEYQLTTVNGEALPFGEDFFTIESGTLTLESDDSYTVQITFGSNGETETDTTSGTYEVQDETITFTGPDDTFTGTLDGNTITITDDALTMVFEK